LVNRGTMDVNNLPKTVTRQRRDCDLNPGPSAHESSTLTTRLLSHPGAFYSRSNCTSSLLVGSISMYFNALCLELSNKCAVKLRL